MGENRWSGGRVVYWVFFEVEVQLIQSVVLISGV